MKRSMLGSLCLAIAFLLITGIAKAQVMINGPDSVCINSNVSYSISPSAGFTYTWASIGGTIQGSNAGSNVSAVWGTLGSHQMTVYGVDNNSVVQTDTINVVVSKLPQPFITTTYRGACLAPGDDSANNGSMYVDPKPPVDPRDPRYLILDDANGCFKVCEGSVVTYYGNGLTGSTYTWAVSGGTIIYAAGDSAIVRWDTAIIGSITVTENQNNCIGIKNNCITIIPKPTSLFTILPNTNPGAPNIARIACIGSKLSFKDYSTGSTTSPVVSWYWDFGDGTSSAQQNPQHTYTASGLYTVKLIVRNACGCRDTSTRPVDVKPTQGPEIFCGSVACENSISTYRTNTNCSSYNWGVTGGSIVADYGDSIDVLWDNVDESGGGYVSLSAPCLLCPGSTTIKVPVIQQHPKITMPGKFCENTSCRISLPLWPGTDYNWGVIGDPQSIPGTRTSNSVIVNFSGIGTYTIHATWQNKLSVCGGDTTFEVEVVPNVVIVGDQEFCKGTTGMWEVYGGYSADWTLTDPNGTAYTGNGLTFSHPFTIPGQYSLRADGSFCADPILITIVQLDLPVDSISGDTSVCIGIPYIYKAQETLPGMIFTYLTNEGTITPLSGNAVQVVWNTLPATLSVYRQGVAFPYCQGPEKNLTILQSPAKPEISGPDTLCPNNYYDYSANIPNGSGYTWEVIPNTAASVQSGNYDNNMVLLTNHTTVSVAAKIVSKVKVCKVDLTDTFDIIILPSIVPTISGPDTVCSGDSAVFTSSPGGAVYSWSFNTIYAGVKQTTVPQVTKVFYNSDTVYTVYEVSVSVVGATPGYCGPAGQGKKNVVVKPGPLVAIYTADTTIYCDTAQPHNLFTATVIRGTPPYTYQWYYNEQLVGTNADTFTGVQFGEYFCSVTDATGCKSSWGYNSIALISTVCYDTCQSINFTKTGNCGVIFATDPLPLTGENRLWTTNPDKINYILNDEEEVVTISYKEVGTFWIQLRKTFGDVPDMCSAFAVKQVTIPLVPDMTISTNCLTNSYEFIAHDKSRFLPWYQNPTFPIGIPNYTSVQWKVFTNNGQTPIATGSGSNWTIPNSLSPGNYIVTLTISLIGFNGAVLETCTTQRGLHKAAFPTVGIQYNPDDICEGIPIHFDPVITPSGTEVKRYLWSFDDQAYSALDTTYRTYTYDQGRSASPNTFFPTLTIVDQYFCTHTSLPGSIDIWQNNVLSNDIPDTTLCSGPVTLTYQPRTLSTIPTDYMWSNASIFGSSPSTTVSLAGSYFVTVEDAHKCRHVTTPSNVLIYQTTLPAIVGKTDYCFGETIRLSCFAGNDLTYNWKLNGNYYLSGPTLLDVQVPGTYKYEMEAVYQTPGGACTTSTAPIDVVVHGVPAPPSINGPTVVDCNTYELELNGSHSSGANKVYNWSNNAYGQLATIYEGGEYRLWYTDTFGCTSYTDVSVPDAPSKHFEWFPAGCYELCADNLPQTISGPPGDFTTWYWTQMPSTTLANGNNSMITPLTISSGGSYRLTLDNGLCTANSDLLNINTHSCNNCPGLFQNISFDCNDDIPGGYFVTLVLDNPFSTSIDVVLGMNIGPMVPFKVNLAPGMQTLNISFNLLQAPPAEVELSFTLPDGTKCFERVPVDLQPYPCGWQAQKPGVRGEQDKNAEGITKTVSGLLLYPNPAQQALNVSYSFGSTGMADRHINVYNLQGVLMQALKPASPNGMEMISVQDWPAGIYIIRMEEDGQLVQVQKATIVH